MNKSNVLQKCCTIVFNACAVFLLVLGKFLGLSYKQISVVFNLWLQGGVLAISAMLPCVFWFCFSKQNGLLFIAGAIILLAYALLYLWGFMKMLRHYHLPIDYAFDLCVKDLEWLATKWGHSYNYVNIALFVIIYLVLLSTNGLLAYLIIEN